MNKRSLGALIALNIALLAALAVVSLSNRAQAQGGIRTEPGEYQMIAGHITGRNNNDLIYLFEVRSSKMVTFFYNSAANTVDIVDAHVINEDLTSLGSR
jgi:hypothetical protein